jgi:glutamyl-tRNA synthetase
MASTPPKHEASQPYIGRLAPSPTGALHLGNIRSFLITWLHCRQNKGKLVLRIEDLHLERIKDGATEQIFDELQWLGLHWDRGPKSLLDVTNQHTKPYIQSQQKQLYEKALAKLIERELAYPCFCTRKDILEVQTAPHGEHELKYLNTCRDPLSTKPSTVDADEAIRSYRFKTSNQLTEFHDLCHGDQTSNVSHWSGDFVIAKGLQRIGYQLAVVLDDMAQGITHVIRGDDLLLSTHRQILIYQALGAIPPQFMHLPLIIGHDGRRLAKRHGDWKISTLREHGFSPEEILGLIAWTMGMNPSRVSMSLESMLERFSISQLPIAPFLLSSDIAKAYKVI